MNMNRSTVWQRYRMSDRANPWSYLLIVSLLVTAYSCTATSRDENEQQEPAITGTIRTSDGSPLYVRLQRK